MNKEELKMCCINECYKDAKKSDRFCSMHRARLSRTGRLDIPGYLEKIFTNCYHPGHHNDCMLWQGHLTEHGYGRRRINGKKTLVHRAVYELINGKIPEGLCVCHACDTPACVNPAHLFLGTHKDNCQDAIKKGRINPSQRGKERWKKCPTLRKK